MTKLERLFTEHHIPMYMAAFKILNDQQLSEDAVQETFMKSSEQFMLLDENDYFRTRKYLVIACENTAKDIYNRNKKIKEDPTDNIEIFSKEISIDDLIISRENISRIRELISELDDNSRNVILLKTANVNYSIKDIAVVLSISTDAARKRLARARQKIKILLTKEGILHEQQK